MPNLKYLDCQIKMPLMSLPVRSICIPTQRGNILISPGSKLTTEQLGSLDNVTDLVAPNLWHCGGISQAQKIFPDVRIWGAPSASKLKPEIHWTNELSKAEWDLEDEISLIPIQGMPQYQEFSFVHKASKTLIVTDLAFNIKNPKGLGSWIILNMFGTYDRFAVSRLYINSVRDKKAFTQSIQEIFTHDFERIVVSHGEPIETNGKALLKTALAERGILV